MFLPRLCTNRDQLNMNYVDITKKKVKNLKGTSEKKCNCKSWIAHWERSSESKAKQCSVVGCLHDAKVGAHVIKCDSSDKNHFIVPMCLGHNQEEDDCLTIDKELVSANIQETCEQ